jgi:tetratricopeptide (TPR) repeat protein
VSGIHLRSQESVDHGLRAIELGIGDENPFSALLPHYAIVLGLLRMGDLDAARPYALGLLDMVERRSTPRSFAFSFSIIASLSLLEGDWKAVREYSDRGLEMSPLSAPLLLPRVMLEYETGESAQGEVYLERLLEAMRRAGPGASARVSMAITAIDRITGIPARLEIAEAAAEEVLSQQSVTPRNAMDAKAGLALLAVRKGDQSAAQTHYAYLQEQRGTMIVPVSCVDRLLGLLAHTMGNLNQAKEHFEDALSFCRKAGYGPELAWTCCDYADTLLQRNEPGDREKAMSLLDESLSISTELGMRPLMERVLSSREIFKA